MKKILPLLAAAAVACSGCTSQPEVRYTIIDATLKQAVAFGSEAEYAKQIYRYPQISGMKNRWAQDSLNRLLKLADMAEIIADSSYGEIIGTFNAPPQHTPTVARGRMYSHDEIEVRYVDNALVSYSGMMEFDGGAHPSFQLRHGTTLAVATLAPIPLSDLFADDYKAFFKQQIIASPQLNSFASDGAVTLNELGSACDDVLDALLLEMDSATTTANMVVTDSAVSILQVDFRDFGCPEAMRGVVEVSIPYALLKPYINPKGYLNRFIIK